MQKLSDLHALLWADYGPLMDAKALCKVLCYPSVIALNTARVRGRLPFSPVTFRNRRGFFALTKEIAEVLERLEVERTVDALAQGEQLTVARQEQPNAACTN